MEGVWINTTPDKWNLVQLDVHQRLLVLPVLTNLTMVYFLVILTNYIVTAIFSYFKLYLTFVSCIIADAPVVTMVFMCVYV